MPVSIADSKAVTEYVLTNGTLSTTEATLWECPAQTQAQVTTLICHNGSSATNMCAVYTQQAGGTSRCVQKQLLQGYERLQLHYNLALNAGDTLRGHASNANQVTWTLGAVKQTTI